MGEKTIVSGEDLVAIVPIIRIQNGVRIDVPAVVVPINIDRAQGQGILIHGAIHITASQTMTG